MSLVIAAQETLTCGPAHKHIDSSLSTLILRIAQTQQSSGHQRMAEK
jgi:hypothetical protein